MYSAVRRLSTRRIAVPLARTMSQTTSTTNNLIGYIEALDHIRFMEDVSKKELTYDQLDFLRKSVQHKIAEVANPNNYTTTSDEILKATLSMGSVCATLGSYYDPFATLTDVATTIGLGVIPYGIYYLFKLRNLQTGKETQSDVNHLKSMNDVIIEHQNALCDDTISGNDYRYDYIYNKMKNESVAQFIDHIDNERSLKTVNQIYEIVNANKMAVCNPERIGNNLWYCLAPLIYILGMRLDNFDLAFMALPYIVIIISFIGTKHSTKGNVMANMENMNRIENHLSLMKKRLLKTN